MMGYYTYTDFGGFGGFDVMSAMIPVIAVIGFAVILGIIVVSAVRGAAQWKKNNDSPVLTVEAEVVAKRQIGRASCRERV